MLNRIEIKSFIFFNFLFSAFLFLFYPIISLSSLKELSFLIPAAISTITLIYLPLTFLTWLINKKPLAKYLIIILFSLLHIATIVDIFIYKIFHYHLNSMAVNLIFTPGGLESLDQKSSVKIIFAIISLLLLSGEYLLSRLSFNIKKLKIYLYILLFSVLADKSMSAYAAISDVVWITENMKVFPLYQPFKIRSFAEKYFGIKAEREIITGKAKGRLRYPLSEIKIDPKKKKFNIIFLVIDSMRFDMFDKEIMPEIYSFAYKNKAFIFKNHFSGGNATRFGIFSIFYGIYGNYWFDISGERKAPVLMDTLQKLGYETAIFAAARITYPEFDRTCFVNIPYTNIYDRPEGSKVDKDCQINQKAIEFISKKRKNPFFAFVFYDSPHGSYEYPKNLEKFKPSAENFNHLTLNPSNIKPVFNRYKNSIYFCDSLIGKLIQQLKSLKLLQNTIVIITGDHGEPFFERGYYGHNQNYSDYEIRVPLIFYIPDKKGSEILLYTSHMDIAATLMNILGVKNPDLDYSQGISLFNEDKLKERKFLAAFSWDTAAIITPEHTAIFPTESFIPGGIKIYNANFEEVKDKNLKKSFNPLFSEFARQYRYFYK